MTKDGYSQPKVISPDWFSLVELIFGINGDGYMGEKDIHVNEVKYHCYYDSLCYTSRFYNIVGFNSKMSDFIMGNVILTKLDKNGDLYSLTDNDLANLKESLYISNAPDTNVMGEKHKFAKIVLKFD